MEDLNRVGPGALKEFLGLSGPLELYHSNVGNNKYYYDVYQEFKNTIRIPQWYIDKMYDFKYMRHFYSETEIEAFRNRWLRNTGN
jgi:hypothetical protein